MYSRKDDEYIQRIADAIRRDMSSMKSSATLAMVFLPGTFLCVSAAVIYNEGSMHSQIFSRSLAWQCLTGIVSQGKVSFLRTSGHTSMLWYPDAAGYVYLEVEDQRDALITPARVWAKETREGKHNESIGALRRTWFRWGRLECSLREQMIRYSLGVNFETDVCLQD